MEKPSILKERLFASHVNFFRTLFTPSKESFSYS